MDGQNVTSYYIPLITAHTLLDTRIYRVAFGLRTPSALMDGYRPLSPSSRKKKGGKLSPLPFTNCGHVTLFSLTTFRRCVGRMKQQMPNPFRS